MTTGAQAEHARIYGEVSRQLMRVAIDFAKGVNPTLSPHDVARIYLAVGSCLAATVTDRCAVAAMLRTLADALEHEGGHEKPN